MGGSMYPTSYSTLIHQLLRPMVRQQRTCIVIISYSASKSTVTRLSLVLCRTRDSSYSTRGWVSNHRLASK